MVIQKVKTYWFNEPTMYVTWTCGTCSETIPIERPRWVGVCPYKVTNEMYYSQAVKCANCWDTTRDDDWDIDVSEKPGSIKMLREMRMTLKQKNMQDANEKESISGVSESPETGVHVPEAIVGHATVILDEDGAGELPTPLPEAKSFDTPVSPYYGYVGC